MKRTLLTTWLCVIALGCGDGSSSTPSAPAMPTPVTSPPSLTGTWNGVAPEGLVFATGSGLCDHDMALALTQSGGAVTGTVTTLVRRVGSCTGDFSTIEVTTAQRTPGQLTGTVDGGNVSLRMIVSRTNSGIPTLVQAIVVSGTFTSTRLTMSGSFLGTRAWNDVNRNGTPDCDLQSAAANGECGAQGTPTQSVTLAATRS